MMAIDKEKFSVNLDNKQQFYGTDLERLAKVEKSLEVLLPQIGQKIVDISLKTGDNESLDKLILQFSNTNSIAIFDSAHICCETRYMTTDDEITYFIGAEFIDINLRNFQDTESLYGDIHDMQFLEVRTSKGIFTIANHNQHNGCYSGFELAAELLK